MRARFALALLIVLAAVGCGSDDNPGQSGPPLSPERYRQIERFMRAALPGDQARTPREIRRVAGSVTRACARLDRSDPLLAALEDGCDEGLAIFAASLRLGCREDRACVRELRRLAAMIDAVVAQERRSERVVVAEVADRECREALLTPSSAYDALERMKLALEGAASAIETGDTEAIADTAVELMEAGAEAVKFSVRKQLDRFREACGS